MRVLAHLLTILALVVATSGFSHADELSGGRGAHMHGGLEQSTDVDADHHDDTPDSAVHCGALLVCLSEAPFIAAVATLPVLEPLPSSTRAYLLVQAEIKPPRS